MKLGERITSDVQKLISANLRVVARAQRGEPTTEAEAEAVKAGEELAASLSVIEDVIDAVRGLAKIAGVDESTSVAK